MTTNPCSLRAAVWHREEKPAASFKLHANVPMLDTN